MKRITPEIALQAFEETGFKPVQEWFYDVGGCACAIGAISVCKGNVADEFTAINFANKEFGRMYSLGFQMGFDGERKPITAYIFKPLRTGYEDGIAAWETVKHLAS